MFRKKVIEELMFRGYHAEERDIVKNGVKKNGIIIHNANSNISPMVYADDMEKDGMTALEAADACIKIFNKYKAPEIDGAKFKSKDFWLKNSLVGIQRCFDNDDPVFYYPTEFNGIHAYIYVIIDIDGDKTGGIKLTNTLMEELEISLCEIIDAAEKNTFKHTKLMNLEEFLGIPFNLPLTIITNEKMYRGASAILDRETLKKYAKDNNTKKIVILPSSIHECILTPYTNESDMNRYSEIVKEINGTEVPPEEQLSDEAYVIEVG